MTDETNETENEARNTGVAPDTNTPDNENVVDVPDQSDDQTDNEDDANEGESSTT